MAAHLQLQVKCTFRKLLNHFTWSKLIPNFRKIGQELRKLWVDVCWPLSEVRVHLLQPLFTKHTLTRRGFVNNCCIEFHENPTIALGDYMTLWTDRRCFHTRRFCYFTEGKDVTLHNCLLITTMWSPDGKVGK
jgi:hypothetical protein